MLKTFIKLILCISILFGNADHLVFNRVSIQPTDAELISIYNKICLKIKKSQLLKELVKG